MHWEPSANDLAEEAAFRRLYGEWQALDPAGLAAFMATYDGEWWVVGGWAIDAFTGQARRHEDIDAVIWLRDLPRFRAPVARADGLKPQAARAQASACVLSSSVDSPSSRRTTSSVWDEEKNRAVRKVRTRSHSAASPRVVAT